MKRLIAISVVFALAAGAAFAVDLSGGVIGTVNFLEGTSAKDANDDPSPLEASAGLNRIRLEGSGENDDGTFGGWLRAEAGGFWGNAWWKPIEQFKLRIGSNGGDGFYGKEGVTGWGFYESASDTGVVNPNGAWYSAGSYYTEDPNEDDGDFGLKYRNAFYGGFGGDALHLTISPADIVDINIAVPFFDGDKKYKDGAAAHIFKRTTAQLDFKLAFGNIAITYAGGLGFTPGAAEVKGTDFYLVTENTGTADTPNWDLPVWGAKPTKEQLEAGTHVIFDTKSVGGKAAVKPKVDPGTFFAYFGLTSIENLGIDVGIGFPVPIKDTVEVAGKEITTTYVTPISAGLGVKYSAGDFGIKVRTVASFAGSVKVGDNDPEKVPLQLMADILPFYSVSDSLRIFFSAGLGLTAGTKEDKDNNIPETDAVVGWHINPYIEVGAGGPKFLAGIKIWSAGAPDKDTDAVVKWAVPLALHVGF